MSFKKLATGLLSVLAIATLASCGTKADKKEATKGEKEKLVVQFVPTNNDGSMEAKTKPFAEYLSKALDKEVSVTLATDYSTIVEAMSSGQVDIGIMPPAAYVQAKDMGAAEAILTSQIGDMDLETGLPIEGKLSNTFKGEVLVKADSNIKELKDLKGT